jgi:FKBP-type peptidyl-prolyl cis-trans isomerase
MSETKPWLTQLSRKRPGVTLVCSAASACTEILQFSAEASPVILEVSCDGVDFYTAACLRPFQSVKLGLKTSAKLDIRIKAPSKSAVVTIAGLGAGSVYIIPIKPVARRVSFNEVVYCSLADGVKYERVEAGQPGRLSGTHAVGRFEIHGEIKLVWLGKSQICKGLEIALKKMQVGEVRIVSVPADLDCKNGPGVYKVRFLGH